MITIKQLAKPNASKKEDQVIYTFYKGSTLIGKAVYMPHIWKSKLSLEVKHAKNSAFYKMWNSHWQKGGESNLSKANALKEFKKWYEFLIK